MRVHAAIAAEAPAAVAWEGGVSGDLPWLGLRGAADAALRLDAEGRIRLEVRSPFGPAAAVAVATPAGFDAWDAAGGAVLHDDDPDGLLRSRSGGRLDLAGLVALLTGRVPHAVRPAGGPAVHAVSDRARGVVASWRDAADRPVELLLDRRRRTPRRLAFQDGLVVEWGDFGDRGGCLLPDRVTLVLGSGAGRASFRARVAACPPRPEDAWFVLELPAEAPIAPFRSVLP